MDDRFVIVQSSEFIAERERCVFGSAGWRAPQAICIFLYPSSLVVWLARGRPGLAADLRYNGDEAHVGITFACRRASYKQLVA